MLFDQLAIETPTPPFREQGRVVFSSNRIPLKKQQRTKQVPGLYIKKEKITERFQSLTQTTTINDDYSDSRGMGVDFLFDFLFSLMSSEGEFDIPVLIHQ